MLRNYFPFLLLSVIVYGLFFYQHQQAVIITPPAFNSGQQSVQLQFVELSESDEEQLVNSESPVEQQQKQPEPISEVQENAQTSSELEKSDSVEKELLVDSKIPEEQQQNTPEPINEVQEKTQTESELEKGEPVEQEQTVDSKSPAETKLAQQKLQKSIQEMTAANAALLKGELYEADFHLDLPAPPRPIKTPKKRSQPLLASDEKQVKTLFSDQSLSSKILQQQEKTKAKRVFKKQPASPISSAENQGVLQEAIVISINKPAYPIRAQKRNQQGRVVVKITVTNKGKAENPEIISSSGYPILDNAVLDFISQELFMPAHKGEEKITSEQLFSFRFELK